MRARPQSPRLREWLVAALVVLGGCGQDFIIGILDGGSGSTTDGTRTEPSGTAMPDTDTSTATSTGTSTDSGVASMGQDSGSDTMGVECEAPTGHSVCDSDDDVFHAIGLDCSGGPSDTVPLVDSMFDSSDANAWRVIREYGNPMWSPTEGSNLLALTTGLLPAADGSGRVEIPVGQTDVIGGNNGNPDGAELPAPISPAPGSQGGAGGRPFSDCDGLGDCSESLPELWNAAGTADDLIWLSFDVVVPAGTFGYRVDLAWFSAEFATRSMDEGTDVAVWWQSSEAFTGNVATIDGKALAASEIGGWVADNGISGDSPDLLGTGHEGLTGASCRYPGGTYPDCPRGGATGWLTLTGPVTPGERLRIAVALTDLVDQERDTTLLLDNWRWYCDGCQPGVDCGLGPLVE